MEAFCRLRRIVIKRGGGLGKKGEKKRHGTRLPFFIEFPLHPAMKGGKESQEKEKGGKEEEGVLHAGNTMYVAFLRLGTSLQGGGGKEGEVRKRGGGGKRYEC